MWRKTVVKRASKYWPKSSDRLDTAIHVINDHEGIEEPNLNDRMELVKKLHAYASDLHTPMELFGFLKSVKDETEHQWLCSQFVKGKKTAGKDKIGLGRNQFFDYLAIFNGDDVSAIEEAKEELTTVELNMVESGLKNYKSTN